MRLYSSTLSTPKRLRLGARLARGVARRPETAPLAATIGAHDTSLKAAYEARIALEPAVDDRSDDVRFGELDAEASVRRLHRLCQELDGDRPGAVTLVGFPAGLSPVIAPQGEAQKAALQVLKTAYAESAHPTVAAHRDALVALVDQAIAAFVPAYDAWVEAVKVRDAAFTVELLRRAEHRRAYDAIFGAIRAAFPNDRRLQDALVPNVRVSRGRPDEDDDEPEPVDSET